VNSRWKPLQPGEPIGVVALSGPLDPNKLDRGLEVLRSWGHPVIEAPNMRRGASYLAGSDAERVEGLDEVLAGGARLLIAARGGYGASRILDDLPWTDLSKGEVTFVGFSDVTAVLNPLAATGAIQVHGPMVASGLTTSANASRLLSLLRGELEGEVLFRVAERAVVRSGRARGHAVGGNLSLLCALIGTPWEPKFDGGLVFIEEVNEALYRLDRKLTHLRCSGRLHNVKALIGGSLRGCKPASERSEVWRRLLLEAAPPGVPVVVDLPFGHGAANLAFPIGATVELDTDALRVTWIG
jgi:muramoyltetrapeptide carboxypeptidase